MAITGQSIEKAARSVLESDELYVTGLPVRYGPLARVSSHFALTGFFLILTSHRILGLAASRVSGSPTADIIHEAERNNLQGVGLNGSRGLSLPKPFPAIVYFSKRWLLQATTIASEMRS